MSWVTDQQLSRLTLILPVLAFNFRRCEAVKIFVDLALNTVSALHKVRDTMHETKSVKKRHLRKANMNR